MGVNIPALFGIYTIIPLIQLVFQLGAGIFVIYFLVSVMKFLKIKSKLDVLRIEQTNRFLELYKSTNEIR